MADISLTQKIKSFSINEGASLVGIASVSRWDKAPIQHSPVGIFPKAKSVIVCGMHIPDACVELGAEDDVRISGLAFVQGSATLTLDHLAFKIARFIEELGWKTVPVPATALWNYRVQPGAERGWMADMCHYYAAACAGLGEIGWNNLCITPQYGTRQRFISIITEAELVPDPLYSGDPLCDKCLLCAKNCPTGAFDKEVDGECVIEIEDKKYTFPKRNLWRCGIGENFQLDVLQEWPEKIDEKVIVEAAEKAVKEHPEWIFGWKMGQCFKWCVNPQRRYFDRTYCKSPRRRRDFEIDNSPENIDTVTREVMALAFEKGADYFATVNLDDLKEKGIDVSKELPDAQGAIILGFHSIANLVTNSTLWTNALLVTNLMEKYGYSTVTRSSFNPEEVAQACGVVAPLGKDDLDGNVSKKFELVITSCPLVTNIKPFEDIRVISHKKTQEEMSQMIKNALCSAGMDMVGIAGADVFDDIVYQVNNLYKEENQDYFIIRNKPLELRKGVWGGQAMPYNPEIVKRGKLLKKSSEYLPNAKSIIVAGMKTLDGVVENVGKGAGKKAAHYQYAIHDISHAEMRKMLQKTAKLISALGYKVAFISSADTDSHFLTANRFAAVASGLGEIGWNGQVLTPQYGPKQIFVALVTDAPLVSDELYKGAQLCQRCYRCAKVCPSQAISLEEEISVSVNGKTFSWGKNDQLRCDWACRYGFMKEAGPGFIGSQTDFPVPEKITQEIVSEAMINSDRLQRPYYKTIVEKCFIECPAGKNNKSEY